MINTIKNKFKQNYLQLILLCVLCTLFLTLSISSLIVPLPESLTYDEIAYYYAGDSVLHRKPYTGKMRYTMPALAFNAFAAKVVDKVAPKSFIPQSWQDSGKRQIYLAKFGTIFLSLSVAILVFIWCRNLYGTSAAFLGLTLYVLDPNIIAHSRVVHQNIYESLGIFVSLYSFWRLLNFGGWTNILFNIVSFGLAQTTRFTALLLIPLYGILALGFYHQKILQAFKFAEYKWLKQALKRSLLHSLALALSAILTLNIFYSFDRIFMKFGDYNFSSISMKKLQDKSPLLRALPVPLPYPYIDAFDFAKDMQEGGGIPNAPAYLHGRFAPENGQNKGFLTYYIWAFIHKVPIASQLIIFMGIISLFYNKNQLNFWRNEAFLLIPSGLFFLIFSLSLSTPQIGIRYIFMIFPLLYVFSSRILNNWSVANIRYRVLIFSLIIYLFLSNISYFPHYLSYFNELTLNRKYSYKVLGDSNLDWGQNLFYLVDYLKKNPESLHNYPVETEDFQLPPSRVFDYKNPRPGILVITANDLVGIRATPDKTRDGYKWIFENLQPIDHVGYSYLVFDIKPEDLPKK